MTLPDQGDHQMSFEVVGHRGAMAEQPENTLAGFAAAEEIGVAEIETDLRVSSDGVVFILHDPTFARVAPDAEGLGPVAGRSWQEIQSVDVGGGQRVPTLVELYRETSTPIQLELKVPEAIDGVVEYFSQHPDEADRTILSGFSAEILIELNARLPHMRRGINVARWSAATDYEGGVAGLVRATGSSRMHCGWEGLTAEAVDQVHQLGVDVHVWPTRDRADLERALALGVEGTTSDDPRAAVAALAALTEGSLAEG